MMSHYSFCHSLVSLEEEISELRMLGFNIVQIIGGHDGWVVAYEAADGVVDGNNT